MNDEYHKINSIFKRDPETKFRTFLPEYAQPEFEYLAGNEWVFTEKVDGTNIRVAWDGEKVRFGGRTDRAQIPTFLFAKLQDAFPPSKFLELYPETPMTLYGEGYGAKIQKRGSGYIPDGVSFILFDIMVGDCWLRREDVEDIGERLGIQVAPIVGHGPLADAIAMVKEGFDSSVAAVIMPAEGLVMRPAVEMLDRRGCRIITKVKSKDFR